MPKFATTLAWQQANLLMQPAFIRIIDNIGKQLEQSTWQGTYQDVQVWAEDVPESTRQQVVALQQQLVDAPPATASAIQAKLDQLPTPYPGYQLCLKKGDRQVAIDIWQLCYQACFRNYQPDLSRSDNELIAEIDTDLLDKDSGDVNWHRLESKTKQLIEQIFQNLPDVSS